MIKELLKNEEGYDLSPYSAWLKLIYSEEKIIKMCKKYMLDNFGIDAKFELKISDEHYCSEEVIPTEDFIFSMDFDSLDAEKIKLLEYENITKEYIIRPILSRIFGNPFHEMIDIKVYEGCNGVMFEIEMPSEYIDKLINKNINSK